MALHSAAAAVISKVLSKKASLKACIYESEWRSKTILTAVVTETLKFKEALDELIENSGIRQKESKILSKLESPWLLHVLLYELLVGRKKSLRGQSAFEKVVLKHKTLMAAEWARLKVKRKARSDAEMATKPTEASKGAAAIKDDEKINEANLQPAIPRYVRVNTLKASVDEVVRKYVERGFTFLETPSTNDDFNALLAKLAQPLFLRDFHMREFLLVFPSGTTFHDCPLYKNGTLILQDKASCLPPFVLRPAPGTHVIDACAAPGNKTTLLAALMENRGRVTAFDISAKRAKVMKQMTSKAGALRHGDDGCVEIRNEDFLTSNPNDAAWKDVGLIVVDPSCSGSGIQTRLNHLTDDDSSASAQRLLQLQDFQFRALTHALSFPRARRVVYSTCSVHAEENEVVVIKALEKSRAEGWEFRLKDALPRQVWGTRGSGGERGGGGGAAAVGGDGDGGGGDFHTTASDALSRKTTERADVSAEDDSCFRLDRCLRASPSSDFTNGFFVALFEREMSDCKKTDDSDFDDDDQEDDDKLTVGQGKDAYQEALDARSRKRRKKREKKKKKKLKCEMDS